MWEPSRLDQYKLIADISVLVYMSASKWQETEILKYQRYALKQYHDYLVYPPESNVKFIPSWNVLPSFLYLKGTSSKMFVMGCLKKINISRSLSYFLNSEIAISVSASKIQYWSGYGSFTAGKVHTYRCLMPNSIQFNSIQFYLYSAKS